MCENTLFIFVFKISYNIILSVILSAILNTGIMKSKLCQSGKMQDLKS